MTWAKCSGLMTQHQPPLVVTRAFDHLARVIPVLLQQISSGRVHSVNHRVGKHDVRMTVQNVDTALQERRCIDVIMICPLEVLRSCWFEAATIVADGTHILGVAEIAEPRISRDVGATDVGRVIRRGIIGNNYLEVLKRLHPQ